MATKIKDGLFLGDAEASQDLEFLELNKVTHVVNCAGRQLPNLFESSGLRYLTFPWEDSSSCVIFDDACVVVQQICAFVDDALKVGQSVLIHCLEGSSRCSTAVMAYFMLRYAWGVEKTFEFLASRRPDISPNGGFMQQLFVLDRQLQALRARFGGPDWAQTSAAVRRRLSDWDPKAVKDLPTADSDVHPENDELVLVNSFLNSMPEPEVLPTVEPESPRRRPRVLRWADEVPRSFLQSTETLGFAYPDPYDRPFGLGGSFPLPGWNASPDRHVYGSDTTEHAGSLEHRGAAVETMSLVAEEQGPPLDFTAGVPHKSCLKRPRYTSPMGMGPPLNPLTAPARKNAEKQGNGAGGKDASFQPHGDLESLATQSLVSAEGVVAGNGLSATRGLRQGSNAAEDEKDVKYHVESDIDIDDGDYKGSGGEPKVAGRTEKKHHQQRDFEKRNSGSNRPQLSPQQRLDGLVRRISEHKAEPLPTKAERGKTISIPIARSSYSESERMDMQDDGMHTGNDSGLIDRHRRVKESWAESRREEEGNDVSTATMSYGSTTQASRGDGDQAGWTEKSLSLTRADANAALSRFVQPRYQNGSAPRQEAHDPRPGPGSRPASQKREKQAPHRTTLLLEEDAVRDPHVRSKTEFMTFRGRTKTGSSNGRPSSSGRKSRQRGSFQESYNTRGAPVRPTRWESPVVRPHSAHATMEPRRLYQGLDAAFGNDLSIHKPTHPSGRLASRQRRPRPRRASDPASPVFDTEEFGIFGNLVQEFGKGNNGQLDEIHQDRFTRPEQDEMLFTKPSSASARANLANGRLRTSRRARAPSPSPAIGSGLRGGRYGAQRPSSAGSRRARSASPHIRRDMPTTTRARSAKGRKNPPPPGPRRREAPIPIRPRWR